MKAPNRKKEGVNQILAAVTGAVVGAGVAIAGAVVFKDKKNREKTKFAFNNMKDQAVSYMKKLQIEKKLATGKTKVKKTKLVKDIKKKVRAI